MKKNIGKNTLGDNKKMSVNLKGYGRSTHNLSYAWRSTMGVGTLVPFMKIIALPEDTFEIDLENKVLTDPTIGPLFGTYKMQMDIFTCPIRLYNAQLHNNALNIGLNMSTVKLPKIVVKAYNPGIDEKMEAFKNINPSSLLSFLGINGVRGDDKNMNAVPYLAYYDIFKNYYANKQEKKFPIVGGRILEQYSYRSHVMLIPSSTYNEEFQSQTFSGVDIVVWMHRDEKFIGFENLYIKTSDGYYPIAGFINEDITITEYIEGTSKRYVIYNTAETTEYRSEIKGTPISPDNNFEKENVVSNMENEIEWYDLEDIDDLRETILAQGKKEFIISPNTTSNAKFYEKMIDPSVTTNPLAGLCLKTHMSDIFNNWVNSEWVDGENGIEGITKIDTSQGYFTIDAQNLAQKVYNMLNRIAVSGGTYKDWIETVYDTNYYFRAETPVYEGGMSSTIEFGQVVSNSATEKEPLGTLAGKGFDSDKKGGKLKIKITEPSYIIGVASITPYVDYSQGNDWDAYLDNMNELRKPELDGIGYQDLLARTMDWRADEDSAIGKQPAWINYMTNFNKSKGLFAAGQPNSFMVLNRIYNTSPNTGVIDNYTTYINPKDYTYIFATNEIENQNFWVQIGLSIKARRVGSAKQIPIM